MAGLGDLIVHIGADIKDFVKGMDKVQKSLQRGVGPEAMNLSRNLVGAFAGLGAGILALGGASIKMAADMEQSKIAFTTMLGSAEKAQMFLDDLAKFAAETPFELPGLIESSKKLLAFGFKAREIKPMLTAIGDAVAGLGGGSEQIDRVTLALGQMQAKGKVSAEEMNQLAELGIPAWQMLADEIGVSIPKAMKMAETGAINAGKALPAILKGMTDKFGGMMEKQSQSLAGLWSTTKDNIGASMRVLGDTLVQSLDLKKRLAGANQWLNDFAKALKDGGIQHALATMIPEKLRNSIVIIAGAIAGAMVPALLSMGVAALTAIVPLMPFIVLGGAIAALGTQIAKLWESPLARFGTFALVLGGLITVLTNAKIALTLWSAVTKIATAVQAAFNAVMSANPIGLVIMAIGALILIGVALYKNWDTVKRIALNTWGAIKATVLDVVAGISEAWGKFVGVFNKAEGDRIKASAQRMREQAAQEREMVDQRNQDAEETAENAARSEQYIAYQKARANDKAVSYAEETKQTEITAANDVKEAKKDYLDEFDKAFDRSQDDAITTFERAQDDQTEAFKRSQDDHLGIFQAAQDKERTEFERGQDSRKTAFEHGLDDEKVIFERSQEAKLTGLERSLEDEKIAFERALDDREIAFDRAQDQEKEHFQRHQEDLLIAFKARQDEEMEALQRRQDAERSALDATFKAQIDKLNATKDAIRDKEAAEEAARRKGDMNDRVSKAAEDLSEARKTGDAKKIQAAEKALIDARQDLKDFELRESRKADLAKIDDQIDALRTQSDAQKDALKERQDTELAAAKDDQANALLAYQRQLNDDKAAFELRLAEKKTQFNRDRAAEMEAFGRKRSDRLAALKTQLDDDKRAFEDRQKEKARQFGIEQADEKTAFEGKQAEALNSYKLMQADELTAWNRVQDDRKTEYKRELDDLKTSFKDKLDEQATFVSNWNAMVDQMKVMAPPASGSTGFAGNAVTTETVTKVAPTDTTAAVAYPGQSLTPDQKDAALETAKAQARNGKVDDAVKTLSDTFGMSVEKAKENLKGLAPAQGSGGGGGKAYMLAAGGIAKQPVVMGEAGPEVFAPLDELWNGMRRLATAAAQGVAARFAPSLATPTAPGGGGGMSQVTIPIHLGGQVVETLVVTGLQVAVRRGIVSPSILR